MTTDTGQPTDSSDSAELAEVLRRLTYLEDDRDVRRMMTRMATLADQRAWDELVDVFTPTVRADWSELSGQPAAEIAAGELVAGWRAGLSGLSATQHLLGNQDVEIDGDRATAIAYVHAAHRLATTFADSVWIVAGSYRYDLQRTPDGWRISTATFHPMWGLGNQQLMTLAASGGSEEAER
jgi:hypothetical protein